MLGCAASDDILSLSWRNRETSRWPLPPFSLQLPLRVGLSQGLPRHKGRVTSWGHRAGGPRSRVWRKTQAAFPKLKGNGFWDVPRALLYVIDILIKTGALFGELCSEVEITLICCPRLKPQMNGSLGFSHLFPGTSWFLCTTHDDGKMVYELLLAKCNHIKS